MNEQNSEIAKITDKAKKSAFALANSTTQQRNLAIDNIAQALINNKELILNANKKDLANINSFAQKPPQSVIDRLIISEKVFSQMIESCEQVAKLPDPIGEISDLKFRPSGIQVGKMRVPLGVVGIIYESRPNVTQEAGVLCLKSGNACVLRGGSEAINSNIAITKSIQQGLINSQISPEVIQIVSNPARELVNEILSSPNIDVLIPRGGKSLVELVSKNARMPVIKHLDGNCAVYVDSFADINKALKITDNSKNQRYSTCNTAETLLIAKVIAQEFLVKIAQTFAKSNLEMRVCSESYKILSQAGLLNNVIKATEDDYFTEYLAPIISVKIVEDVNSAIAHINYYGSHHTDAIISENHSNAMQFLREVDSASVMINASTRFADGFEYGLGAEIGISTDKFHARGPVGLEGLTSQKWVVFGSGEIRL